MELQELVYGTHSIQPLYYDCALVVVFVVVAGGEKEVEEGKNVDEEVDFQTAHDCFGFEILVVDAESQMSSDGCSICVHYFSDLDERHWACRVVVAVHSAQVHTHVWVVSWKVPVCPIASSQ